MKRKSFFALMFLIAAIISTPASKSDASLTRNAGLSSGETGVTHTLLAGPFQITEGTGGGRIEMEGFGYLMIPGKPQLPMKRVLVALPPGALARSVEIIRSQTDTLPGTYEIAPFPPVRLVSDSPRFDEAIDKMDSDWHASHDAAYNGDTPFPEKIAWLGGSGTLRKYSYASIAFCPFTWHPESGRLSRHDDVEIEIRYTLPSPGGAEAEHVERLLLDRVADKRASGLFVNFHEIENLYSVDAAPGADRREAYDYVIVTTAGNVSAVTASDFPSWKTALGHNVRTVLTTDMEITTQPGADLAEQMRNFLRSYYPVWGIEYVLLVGNYADVPMRICYPNPNFHTYNPADPGLVAPGTPTDYYYADLSFPDTDSWDLDGDGFHGEFSDDNPDFLAEVAVGRIPVNVNNKITYALNKIVAFEQDSGPWKRSALLAAAILFYENENHGGGPFVDGATCLDSIDRALLDGWTVTRQCEQAGLSPSGFPWSPLTEANFNTAWRTGEYAVVNWSGHGWCDGAYRTIWEWDDGDGVPESDGSDGFYSSQFVHVGSSILDDDHPSIVFAISCNVGYPESNAYGRMGVDLLTRLGWGASAGIVSASRPAAVSGDWMNSPGGTESICYEFNRYMIAEEERVGNALYDGKFHATSNYGWHHYYEFMDLYNFNLYGDPALAVGGISTGVADSRPRGPRAALHLEPGHPNPFTSATTVRFNLPVDTPVQAAVYDIRGRKVAGLVGHDEGAGQFAVTWNGTDDTGEAVPAGLYFVSVEAGTQKAVRKIVRLR